MVRRRAALPIFVRKHRPWYERTNPHITFNALRTLAAAHYNDLEQADKVIYEAKAAEGAGLFLAADPVADANVPPPRTRAQRQEDRQQRARVASRRRAASMDSGRRPPLPALPQLALPAFVPGPAMAVGSMAVGPIAGGTIAAAGSIAPGPIAPAPVVTGPGLVIPVPHPAGMYGFTPAIIDAPQWQNLPIHVPASRLPRFNRPDDSQDNGIWKCVDYNLAEGSDCRVCLWIRVENGRIMQRMVTKDLDVEHWSDPNEWYQGQIDDVPMEAAMHYEVSRSDPASPDCEYILKYHGFRASNDLRLWRIATEYAEYGNLWNLVDTFLPNEGEIEKAGELDGTGPELDVVPMLPLRFVLDLFRALIIGLKHITDRGVIHRDLKLDNIFLAKPQEGSAFYDWGVHPLIADFGHSRPIPSSELFPQGFVQGRSPEQTWTHPRLSQEPQNEKTNVFQLGYVMAYMFTGTVTNDILGTGAAPKPIWLRKPASKDAETQHLDNLFCMPRLKTHFSILLTPVMDCLRFEQKDRPTLEDLLAIADNLIKDDDKKSGVAEEDLPRNGRIKFKQHLNNPKWDQWGERVAGINNARKPVDSHGGLINHQGQRVNAQGQRINEAGELLNHEGKRINALGQLLNHHGTTVDEFGRRINTENHRINRRGFRINETRINGKRQLVDQNDNAVDVFGRLVDEDGELVNTDGENCDKEGRRRVGGEGGRLINSRGEVLKPDGTLLQLVDDTYPDSDECSVDPDGDDDEDMVES